MPQIVTKKIQTTNNLEGKLLSSTKYSQIVGIDEAGRGAWAGPVSVGYYIYTKDTIINPIITDSKLLSHKKRQDILAKYNTASYNVLFGSPTLIDKLGIGKTIEKLILDIVKMFDNNTFFLIDGQFSKNLGPNTLQINKGDVKHYSIAAASIGAKELRDEIMVDYGKKYPNYGFENHVGYGTKAHQEALQKYGVLDIHRKSYKPIAKLLLNTNEL